MTLSIAQIGDLMEKDRIERLEEEKEIELKSLENGFKIMEHKDFKIDNRKKTLN